MTALLPPEDPEFRSLFTSARYTIFRLETRQSYANSGEDPALAAFLAGDRPVMTAGKQDWVDLIHERNRAGCLMQRVHVLTPPLTDYVRFELAWSYPHNVRAGEEVHVIALPGDLSWPIDVPRRDFWLFDSNTLIDMHYDADGAWRAVEQVRNPARIVAACLARDAALHHAAPWAGYIGEHPELARLVPPEVTPEAS